MANVAINGFGRIGRAVFKLLVETPDLHVVAINDLSPPENLVYLLRYDTVYGRYPHPVRVEGDTLAVNGNSYQLVFECTGVFNKTPRLWISTSPRS